MIPPARVQENHVEFRLECLLDGRLISRRSGNLQIWFRSKHLGDRVAEHPMVFDYQQADYLRPGPVGHRDGPPRRTVRSRSGVETDTVLLPAPVGCSCAAA